MDFAEFPEPLAVPDSNARCDGFEVSIMCQKNGVKVLSRLGDDGVLGVRREHIPQPND